MLLVLVLSCSEMLAFSSSDNRNENPGGISGTVVDEHGDALPQATVIVVGRRIGGYTDSIGRFTFPRVPAGACTIRAAKINWGRAEMGIDVAAGRTTIVDLVLKRSAGAPAPTFTGTEVPCDDPGKGDPEVESLVQVGVSSDSHEGVCTYVYKVLNRTRDTLTEVRIGFDARRGVCELTGVAPHVVPDTAYGPPGWVCTPIQAKDKTRFALSWTVVPGREHAGLAPNSYSSSFTVALRQRDSLYAGCHWFVGAERRCEDGRLKPDGEIDAISMATGAISGSVTDLAGTPISAATVSLLNSGLDAITDSDGTYLIPDAPVGSYRVGARALDYEGCTKGHVHVEAGDTTRVDFRLSTGTLSIPCAAYTTARERMDVPFPQSVVETDGARFLDRTEAIPPKLPGEVSRPQPYIYSLTRRDVEVVFRGLGQDTARRAFVAKVRREFRNPAEERLLRIAEETYPPSKAIVLIADQRSDRNAMSKEKRLWWYGEFDGVRLPYAVTMDAVRYYLGLTQALGRGESTETGIPMKACNFSYSAHVSSGPTTFTRDGRVFQDVYAVDLKLEWWNYCSPTCACMFHLERTVLLRPDGTVVCVFGDRKPRVAVS
jgi:hypothetical protein